MKLLSRKALALGLMPVVTAGLAVTLTQTAADAAVLGTVSLSPASGSVDQATTFTASAPCNEVSDKYLVTMVGGGVTTETNIIGNSALSGPGGQVTEAAIADGTFRQFASSNGFTLAGPATLTIKCMHGIAGIVDDTFTSVISFTGTGAGLNYALDVPPPTPTPTLPDAQGTVVPGTPLTFAPPANGVGASIAVDSGSGAVEIFHQNAAAPAGLPPGHSLFGKQLSITAPAVTAPNFYTFTFTLDGTFDQEPVVYKDGAAVPECTNESGAPAPAPSCVSDIAEASGDTVITVRTLTASVWNFAEPPVPPGPNEVDQNVSVFVPENVIGGTGAFTITVPAPGDGAVSMGTPVNGSQDGTFYLDYNAPMDAVQVTDTRLGAQPWTVVGQMANFNPALIFGRYMGWTPAITTAGMGAVAGPTVASGYPGSGSGLNSSQILASAPDGHEGGAATEDTALLGATLNLRVPTAVPTGTYNGVLTLTALS